MTILDKVKLLLALVKKAPDSFTFDIVSRARPNSILFENGEKKYITNRLNSAIRYLKESPTDFSRAELEWMNELYHAVKKYR